MKTRILALSVFLLSGICVANLSAQDKRVVPSKLKEATVFLRGAELTHSISCTLDKGENEIYVEGLSPNIDRNSLKIKTGNGVFVSSYEFSVDYLTETKQQDVMVQKLQDSVTIYTQKLEYVANDIKVTNSALDLLQKGISKTLETGEDRLAIAELTKTMDYFNAKSKELYDKQIMNNRKKQAYEEAISKFKLQINQGSLKNNKTSGILRLNLSSPSSSAQEITVSYYTAMAAWVPYYDINVTSIDKPVKIICKSKVSQTTGLDWEKVKLTLSTATPSSGKVAPLFSAWFLNYYAPVSSTGYARKDMMVQNSYSYNADVAEIVVAKEDLKYNSMDNYITQQETDLDIVYNIDLPYTIPGNGKEQSIDMLTKEINAEYQYYCAPKLDLNVYLLAEISGWEKLNLLSGKANITYDGTYIGDTYIDARSTKEKLSLTLGADKRVTVKREKQTDYTATKTIGSDTKQTFSYKLTLKNNQNKAIKMVLKDQYPISGNKDITVELLTKETTPWTANKEEVGVITWEEEIKPGTTKEYQITYTVKYPKGSNLNL